MARRRTRKHARLERWFREGNHLVGYVYGHPDYNDGARIVTDPLTETNFRNHLVRTRDTDYTLEV